MSSAELAAIAGKSNEAIDKLKRIAESIQKGFPSSQGLAISSSVIENALDRFMLWVGNMGALHQPNSRYSLEKRLSEAPEVKAYITNLLDDLLETLEDFEAFLEPVSRPGSSQHSDNEDESPNAHDDYSDMPEEFHPVRSLTRELSQTLNQLFRVAILVRNAKSEDRFQRAMQLSTVLPSKWDVEHVEHKHPKLTLLGTRDKNFALRLGTAISKRRQFLAYAMNHAERLSEGKGKAVDLHSRSTTAADDQTIFSGATTLKVTKAFEKIILSPAEEVVEDDAISMASAKTTFDSARMLRLPKLESLQTPGPEFECPLCHTLQAFSNERTWRAHAYRDLKAYICTASDSVECEKQMFSDRNTWFQHELEEHRSRYVCTLCKDGTFEDKIRLRDHISSAHSSDLGEEQMQLLASSGRLTQTQFSTRDCPFCDEWDTVRQQRTEELHNHDSVDERSNQPKLDLTIVSAAQFKCHVATHQEQLALFAVPGLAAEDDDDAYSDGSTDQNETATGPLQQDDIKKPVIIDIREEIMTEEEAYRKLTTYKVVRMEKVDEGTDPKSPTWTKVLRSQQDVPKQDAERRIDELQRTDPESVTEKKQDLPTELQRQLELAQETLEQTDIDRHYEHTLVQLEGLEQRPPSQSDRQGRTAMQWSGGRHRSKRRIEEPGRKIPAAVDAIFRRSPRPGVSSRDVIDERDRSGDKE